MNKSIGGPRSGPAPNAALLSLALLTAALLVAFTTTPTAVAKTPGTSPNTITRSFSFESPTLGATTVNGTAYTTISMPGALTLARHPGEPALPVRFVQILLPPGTKIAGISVTGLPNAFSMEGVDLKAAPLFPYQHPVPIGSARPTELEENASIYGSADPFPAENYAGEHVGFCRGYAILSMGLHPVRYMPARGALSWFSEMTVKVDLEEDGTINPFFRNSEKDADWVRHIVCNPAMTAAYDKVQPARAEYPGGLCDPADDYDYVIVTTTQNGLDHWSTTPQIPYNWDSLMNKHALDDGLKCTLVTIQDILAETAYENPDPLFNDTPARIREFCKDAYQDWGASYIMVGGDAEWIPARLMDSSVEYNVDSDIYWNHLDKTFNDDHDNYWGEEGDSGFDEYAEMFIGRITADEPQDVSNWLTKCFYYADSQDRDFLDNAAFYGGDTGWNCEGDDFIDYSAIQGLDHWLGPNPGANPYPSWLGFQYGFETWNQENPGAEYDMTVKWTAEPPNPTGWQGGSTSAATSGLRTDINNDHATLIFGIAHANEYMSLDVGSSTWESSYHNTKPFFIHDYGCHCGDMDAADDGVLHSMLMHSDTELAFACVYNTGYGWGNFDNTCSSSAVQQKSVCDYLFDVTNNSGSTENWQAGKAMTFARDLMAPTLTYSDGSWRETIQCCLLFGDPAQTLKPPAVPALFMSFPQGIPEGHYPPGPATVIEVQIRNGLENYVPGTAYLHYRFDPQSAYIDVPLVPLGGDLYEADLPNTSPGDEPEFYFSAQGDGGTTVYAPWNAPSSVYSFDVYMIQEIWHDDFESDTGWTVTNQNLQTGAWERCVPNPTSGQQVAPLEDNPAGTGTYCYVTENGPPGGSYSSYDVDGGPTILTSPILDLSQSADAVINAYCWYYSRDGNDPFKIDVSDDGGATWTNVFSTNGSLSGWQPVSFRVADYVTPTAHVKVRYSAQDQPNNDIVEAGLDDFGILRIIYDPSIWAEAYSFSAPAGCYIPIHLNAGSSYAGRNYAVAAGFSGSMPGTPLPGGRVLPVNWDWLTTFILNNPGFPVFENFRGTLDGQGTATAALNLPGPGASAFIGQTMTLAFTLTGSFDFVSNPIDIEIEP